MPMKVRCNAERCKKVAKVSADFKFCPYCATRYIEKGIDVPDLVATESEMKNYRLNKIAVSWIVIVLLWAGSMLASLYYGIIDRFVAGYFFDWWLAFLPVLLVISALIIERFFVKQKFKEVYTQPDK